MSVPQRDDQVRTPIFNAMPAAVLILAIAMAAVAMITTFLPETGRWIFAASLVIGGPAGMSLPAQPLGHVAPLVLHVFIHFGWFHLVMNLAVLIGAGRAAGLALGDGVKGTAGFFVFFFVCAIAGAGLEILLPHDQIVQMGGASTGVSGLIAAAGWVRGGYRGMLSLTLPWIGFNVVIALTGMVLPIPISWAGHIGGVVAGACLFPLVLAVFGEGRGRRFRA
ncbi:rhomboid family intramembrane serine protease [Maricaulis salignorans]|uniref:Membrane associated serine protease, rhomboid family n=1 Tax=Maricaulis salignorans TaxID=144026 RepID=A0A1G9TTP3_9PROT|nr:rhomboid family intramembrane serine protease [Maricaulis salignorans]SDM51012.1 Membrane associated serine protease, rhomboid family [Maricaulis salignorans]